MQCAALCFCHRTSLCSSVPRLMASMALLPGHLTTLSKGSYSCATTRMLLHIQAEVPDVWLRPMVPEKLAVVPVLEVSCFKHCAMRSDSASVAERGAEHAQGLKLKHKVHLKQSR